MTWPFPGWGWDHWPELWSSAPSTTETAQEPAGPSPLDWASVHGQAPVKIVVPYRFTVEDEAAEAVVLDELAVLGEQGLSSWAAADRLFNAIGSGGADVAGVAPGGDGPRSGPEATLTPPGADPLPV
ncbi:hypothetical protein ACIBQX_11595 [Nonomuraea sp. NPDC049714]|uniref:hypothetical protein n=1 Tax=Nonomuraea sp. NPDC049714 TaxID=3364357 RepID=UPI0037B00B61